MFVVQSEREASEQTLANTAKTHDRMKNEQRGWLHVCFVVLHLLPTHLSVSILQAEASRTVPDCTARCKERTHVCFQPFSGIHCTAIIHMITAGRLKGPWTRWLRSGKRLEKSNVRMLLLSEWLLRGGVVCVVSCSSTCYTATQLRGYSGQVQCIHNVR